MGYTSPWMFKQGDGGIHPRRYPSRGIGYASPWVSKQGGAMRYASPWVSKQEGDGGMHPYACPIGGWGVHPHSPWVSKQGNWGIHAHACQSAGGWGYTLYIPIGTQAGGWGYTSPFPIGPLSRIRGKIVLFCRKNSKNNSAALRSVHFVFLNMLHPPPSKITKIRP